jgi:hypothetical protein
MLYTDLVHMNLACDVKYTISVHKISRSRFLRSGLRSGSGF